VAHKKAASQRHQSAAGEVWFITHLPKAKRGL
jgi:hypothetical protein